MKVHTHCFTCCLAAFVLLPSIAQRACGQPQGKISRNIYRIPYADTVIMRLGGNDYVNHGGSMDSFAQSRVCTNAVSTPCSSDGDCSGGGTCEYVLVAPADGIVCQLVEHYDDCGSSGAFGPFGNTLVILHDNGEMSRFLHLVQWSPSLFGIQPGMFVSEGQPVGIEGEVGRTSGPSSGVSPRVGTCLETVPDGAGDCGRHLHWNIIRATTGEAMNPFTCGIPGNVYHANDDWTAPCDGGSSYPNQSGLSGQNYSGFGTFEVRQAHQTITASTVTVANQASLVLHAGDKVTLTPGFHARAGGYFRAEAAPPDVTAASTVDYPNVCPCSGAVGFCYQWTDVSSGDNIAQGCNPVGPAADKCHGCPGISGGNRCCPCIANGTCQ